MQGSVLDQPVLCRPHGQTGQAGLQQPCPAVLLQGGGGDTSPPED